MWRYRTAREILSVLCHQPGGCSIEQESRTVIPRSAEHVEPAHQPEASRGVLLQVAKPVALADHRIVEPATVAIPADGVRVGSSRGAKEAGGAHVSSARYRRPVSAPIATAGSVGRGVELSTGIDVLSMC